MHQKDRLKKINQLQQMIKEEELDAMLITGEANRTYLSGFEGSFGYIMVSSEGRAMLITDFRYVEQAEMQAPHLKIIKQQGEFADNVSKLTEHEGWTRLGIEEEHMSYFRYRELLERFEGELVPLKKRVEHLRAIKEPSELEKIKKSASFLDDATRHMANWLQPGVSEKAVALELEYYLRKQGAQGPTFGFIVASGERSSLPHGVASSKVLQEGETVTIDFGVYYQGYASDMTRNFSLGEPNNRLKEIHQLVYEAQQVALKGFKAGMTGRQVDALAREVIEEGGYGDYFGHGLGHGVGLEPHELPTLSPRVEGALQVGAVVTVEPGIYIPQLGGIRIEDMVLVKEDGVELLTHSSRELMVV